MATCKDLLAWQRGMDLTERIYAFTKTLPADERFGLWTQLRRAAVSIPGNLSEGHSRRSSGAYLNHVSIALGSQAEVETLLETCRRLTLGDSSQLAVCVDCAEQTGRILYGLHKPLDRARLQRGLLYSMLLLAPGLRYLVPGLWHLAVGL